ncbi:MAG TPA: ferredoxin--NADP reductase [Legionellaceae bacterium]|nr:ferredoxin--NADP reductase [Legionellaceae bacterium]
MPTEMLQFQLESTKMLSPKAKHFVLTHTSETIFDYLPGQFITVHFEHQGKMIRRSYSIANAPKKDNRLEFAATYVEAGPGSEYLFNLKVGDHIQITGPFGRLTLKEECPKRYILVATSTGVTPYRSMIPDLQQRLESNPELSIVILEGVQTHQDLLYEQDFLNWAQQNPRVLFRAFLSRENKSAESSHLCHGYVQHGFANLNLNAQQDHVFLCGNPAMIDEAFQMLKEQGFSTQQIVREKYISSTK